MSVADKVFRSSVFNVLDHIVRFVALFLITPLMVHTLGQHTYGIWLLLITVFSYFKLFDIGIGMSSTHLLAKSIGGGDEADLQTVVSTCTVLFRRIALISLAVTAVAIPASSLFISDDSLLRTVQIGLAIYGAGAFVRFQLLIYQALLKSQVRYELIVVSSLFKVILQTTLTIAALKLGFGLVSLVLVLVLSQVAEQLILAFYGRKFSGEVRVSSVAFDRKKMREIIRYSITSFFNSLGMNMKNRFDPIVVAGISGVAWVPIYSVGARFMTIFCDIINSLFGGQVLAAFSQIEGTGNRAALEKAFFQTMKLAVIATTFGAFSIAVYCESFILRWLGPGFQDSYYVVLILAIPNAFFLMQYPAFNLLYAKGKHGKIVRVLFVSGLANLVLSIIFGLWIGFFGVIWATFCEMMVFYLLIFPPIVCREGEIDPARYYLHSIFGTAAKTLLPLIAFYFAIRSFLQPDYLRLAILATLQGVVFLPVFFVFLLNREDRAMIKNAVARHVPGISFTSN